MAKKAKKSKRASAAKKAKPAKSKKSAGAAVVGKIIHFYDKIKVAAIEVLGNLKKGDRIEVIRPIHVLAESVQSMQINRKNVKSAKKGQVIGLKVNTEVRKGDVVYKVA